MGTQDRPERTVTAVDVLAVLELARLHLDMTVPVPASWDAVIAQIRAVLVEQTTPLLPEGATPRTPATGGSTRHS